MLQYYTLNEAAKVLHTTPDKVQGLTRPRKIRALQDGKTLRFKRGDIEELARELGLGSDPELQLGDALPVRTGTTPPPGKQGGPTVESSDELVPLGTEERKDKQRSSGKFGPKSPKPASDSDVRLVTGRDFPIDEDIKLANDPSPSPPPSSKQRRSTLAPPKPASDSGVRLVPPDGTDSDVKIVPADESSKVPLGASRAKSPSDSDIRLDGLLPPTGRKAGEGVVTEEIEIREEDIEAAGRATAGKKQKPRPKSKLGPPKPASLPTESPFEISEDDLTLDDVPKKKSKPGIDSSSDFDLIPLQEDHSPIELGSGEIPLLSDDEVELGSSGALSVGAGNSGINLNDPADSGISLEQGGSDEIEFDDLALDSGSTPRPGTMSEEDSESEFELTLDDESLSPMDEDSSSDSEFELTLDEGGEGLEDSGSDSEFELTLDAEGDLSLSEEEDGKDIFEATNFDVPALDEEESASEAMALEELEAAESSEFELDLDLEESGSQAVEVEDEADEADETVARPRKTKAKAKTKSKLGKKPRDEDEDEDLDINLEADEDEDVEREPVYVEAPPAEWGALPAMMLLPTVLILFFVGLMGFELIRGMWGYSRPSAVSRPIIHNLAKSLFDNSLPNE